MVDSRSFHEASRRRPAVPERCCRAVSNIESLLEAVNDTESRTVNIFLIIEYNNNSEKLSQVYVCNLFIITSADFYKVIGKVQLNFFNLFFFIYFFNYMENESRHKSRHKR